MATRVERRSGSTSELRRQLQSYQERELSYRTGRDVVFWSYWRDAGDEGQIGESAERRRRERRDSDNWFRQVELAPVRHLEVAPAAGLCDRSAF